jgi:hypothetical protein
MASFSRSSTSSRSMPATRARQGRFGRHMFWVLLVSTALAAIALFGAWTWRADDLASAAPNNANQPQDAQAFDQGAPAALQTPPNNGATPAK